MVGLTAVEVVVEGPSDGLGPGPDVVVLVEVGAVVSLLREEAGLVTQAARAKLRASTAGKTKAPRSCIG